MVNSRRKGNQGERDVITVMREYFPGKWERKSMGIPGPDILPPPDFLYAIEVKNTKTLRLKHLFKPTKQLQAFWQQAVEQAIALNKLPLLVAKIEGMWLAVSAAGETCLPSHYEWQRLEDWCDLLKELEHVK